jgi:hypothetical protein
VNKITPELGIEPSLAYWNDAVGCCPVPQKSPVCVAALGNAVFEINYEGAFCVQEWIQLGVDDVAARTADAAVPVFACERASVSVKLADEISPLAAATQQKTHFDLCRPFSPLNNFHHSYSGD